MSKRKRELEALEEWERDLISRERWYVMNIGLAEVDEITNGDKFRRLTETSSSCPRPLLPEKSPKADLISRLPNEILQFIISNLSMREAAATCVLSRRWRSLWATSVSRLNFDIPNMQGHNHPRTLFADKPKQFLTRKTSNFTHWVNRVLKVRRASRFDALRVCFALEKRSASHIDRWIKSAAAQGVTDIDLNFNLLEFYGVSVSSRDMYKFPAQEVASSLQYLRLRHCIFHLPPDFTGFTSLVSLSLTFIEVPENLMEGLLSKCPRLKCLSLSNCFYHANVTSLKFCGPSLPLKHLHLYGVSDCMEMIEVHDINLLSLEVTGIAPPLSLKNAPHLARLVLFSWAPLPVKTLSNVPRLEILFLMQPFRRSSFTPISNLFTNLKRLAFVTESGIAKFISVLDIIEACTLLQELELNLQMSSLPTPPEELISKLSTVPRIVRNKLKEIEIYGFEVRPEKLEFVQYLLKYAVSLERMKIYTTGKVYRGNHNWTLREGAVTEAKSLEEVIKLLGEVACSSTKLEVSTNLSL